MDRVQTILKKLKEANIQLSLKGEQIEVASFDGKIEDDIFEEIKSNRISIIDYLNKYTHERENRFLNIQKVVDEESYPLSSAQRRLWVLSQLEEGNIAYNADDIYLFEGNLDRKAFEDAACTMVSRHEILRTVFRKNGTGDVRQFVMPVEESGFMMAYMDLRTMPVEEVNVRDRIKSETASPFNLESGPLVRASLLQLQDEKYVFILVMHHIICDGWSRKVIIRELVALYMAYKGGRDNPLAPLRIQYRDYSIWQLGQLKENFLKEQRSYWLNQFGGPLPVLELPGDNLRPALKTYNGGVQMGLIHRSLTLRLKQICREEGATLFMGLLASVKALLYRYTNQGDIIIGSPIAGRDHVDLEDQLGFYVNTLALRTKFDGKDSFLELLRNVRKVTIDAYANQLYPFDELVEEVYVAGDISRHALFDVMIALQNTDIGAIDPNVRDFGDFRISMFEKGHSFSTSKFDLLFDFTEIEEVLHFNIHYNSDIYGEDRVERLNRHLLGMIDGFTKHPERQIDLLEYLCWDERQKLLLDFNATSFNYPLDKSIVELFEQQVLKNPGKTALVFQEERWSYAELNEQANEVAHFLIDTIGLEKEDGVGLLFHRGADFIISMLGVLKAGGMYVPLESDDPEDRLKFVINDNRIGVIITEKKFIETVNRLQWTCNCLNNYLCTDSPDVYSEEEKESAFMSQELWDHVGHMSVDQITGGGWIDSFTGDAISEEEMEEYAMNIYNKLSRFLHREMRVLEIGCSSGLTMNKIAPDVGFYYGTDLSSAILEKTQFFVDIYGLTNVKLKRISAHEISGLEECNFDLVIINSVIQTFGGHNYLRRVIKDAIGLMKNDGYIFIGDVMDLEKKDSLIRDLEAFKGSNRDKGYTTKTDFSTELFVAKGFLKDLQVEEEYIETVEIGEKIFTIENELTKYRYDAILMVNKSGDKRSRKGKQKRQFSSGVLCAGGTDNPLRHTLSDHLAYTMYTSGSTGIPKGVMIEQKSVIRLVYNNYIPLSERDTLLSTGSLAFDATTFEFWSMLLRGGTLVMCSDESLLDPKELAAEIAKWDVSIMWFTAGWFNQLVDIDPGLFAGVGKILVGGDKLSPYHIRKFKARNQDTLLINGYGPTENTTFSLTYVIDSIKGAIPVGTPIGNSTAYILDRCMGLLPVGITGEIYLGGDGLARGYLNNKELTRERFVPHPFEDGKRLYKTGDLGRWTAEGNIEFMGRNDDQVKIRGYRVELGEITFRLLSYDSIEDAAVLVKNEEDGEKILVAYIVSKEELNVPDIQAYLGKHLPDYMFPRHYVRMDKLLLTANGKLDKKRLPDLEGTEIVSGGKYVAPRNETEARLVEIWQKVLGVDNVGVKDNFFELGGHSLKITRLLNNIYKQFGAKLPIVDLFNYVILEEQAVLIEQATQIEYSGIVPVEEAVNYSLSASQRRLWIISQFEDGSVAYNVPGVYEFSGDLDLACFERAIQTLLERHETLRTVFKEDEGGNIKQWIQQYDRRMVELCYHDLRRVPDNRESVALMVKNEIAMPFDLAGGPLLRTRLFQISDDKYVFIFVMHHIISDGWSLNVMIRELSVLYNAYRTGEDNPLIPMRIQYRDYAAWQELQLSSEKMVSHHNYWLKQFEGELPVLEIPAYKTRPAVRTYNGRAVSFAIDRKLTDQLNALAKRSGATLFMGLLGALVTLLHRYTLQEDIIIGSPIAGREHADLEDQIGFYVNTLALRIRFKADDHFSELLRNIKRITLGAYEHQVYPFDELVDKLNLNRDISRHALFDVMLVLHNTETGMHDSDAHSLRGVKVDQYREETHLISKFDLNLDFREGEAGLHGRIEYNSDIYDRVAIEQFGRHFCQAVREIVEYPDRPISELNYLGEDERYRILSTFNDTVIDYQFEKSIIDLFERQVAKTPDGIALVFEDTVYTYAGINKVINKFSRYIKEKSNLHPGDCVYVLTNRSEWAVITMISIMKLGAVYVPIDKSWPESRIMFVFKEDNARVVISDDESLLASYSYLQKCIVSIKSFLVSGDIEDTNLEIAIAKEASSYIIYTSGSTGIPKGVEQTYLTLYNLISWEVRESGLLHEERHLQFSSFGFDSSLNDVLYTICTGGELHVLNESLRKDIWQLRDYILEKEISIVSMPYAALNSFFSEISFDALAGHKIKQIISTGEQLYITGGLRAFLQANPSVRIFNLYGPSETHVVTGISYSFSVEEIPIKASLGKPIRNSSIYILDSHMQLVPVGVEGEIYIGGMNLATGYIGNPELTADRFCKNPFNERERIYRSGDIGKWLFNGELEYMMRADNQVKISGHRVELDEVELAIKSYSPVEDATVLVKERTENIADSYLCAYVVGREGFDIEGAKRYLSRILPMYMIPSFFVQLERIPVTSNGKVDKKRLSAFEGPDRNKEVEYVGPDSEIESKLVQIWESVLARNRIGTRDSFFDLGGNSLKSIIVLARIRQEFGVKLAIETFFMLRSIDGIAREIDTLLWVKNNDSVGQGGVDIESMVL